MFSERLLVLAKQNKVCLTRNIIILLTKRNELLTFHKLEQHPPKTSAAWQKTNQCLHNMAVTFFICKDLQVCSTPTALLQDRRQEFKAN